MSIIELKNISKQFGKQPVLRNINLQVRQGEFLSLLGPSGCGKTTLLRLLSGFERPDSGEIFLAGREISQLPAQQRNLHTVFQNYALFPHLSVFDNVAFPLQCRKLPKAEIQTRVIKILETVHMENYAQHTPEKLSGGQKQRVAIARAVVNEPLVLLLDEPLNALDRQLRKSMQVELKQIQRQLGITFIFVTHDQEEALSMSDRVAVLHHGRIEQLGTPRNLYEQPINITVARFVGELNIFDTIVETVSADILTTDIEGVHFSFANKNNFQTNDKVHVLVRPEDLRVWDSSEISDTHHMLPGTVTEIIYKGSTVDLIVRLPSGQLLSATTFFDEDDENLNYAMGEKVWINWIPGWEVILPYDAI